MFGSLTGSMLPFILRRTGFDPASASAPFVATLVDVTGLVIYFTVASLILRGTLLQTGQPPGRAKGKARWLNNYGRIAWRTRLGNLCPCAQLLVRSLKCQKTAKPCILRLDRHQRVCRRGARCVVDRRRCCGSEGGNEQFASTLSGR
jgi:hypothetical protein